MSAVASRPADIGVDARFLMFVLLSRAVIIGREGPQFKAGLVKEVAVTARSIIKHLNKVQQKAIFR